MSYRSWPVVVMLTASVLYLGSACGDATVSEEQAKPFVQDWSEHLGPALREQSFDAAGDTFLKARLEEAAAKQEAEVQRDGPPYDVLARDVYADHDYALLLVGERGLTERGEAVWSALQQLEDHALSPEKYAREAIRARLDELESLSQELDALAPLEPDDALRSVAMEWLVAQPSASADLSEAGFGALTEAMSQDLSGASIEERVRTYEDLSHRVGKTRAHLEHLLARDALRYARDMKHFRLKEIFVHQREDDPWTDPEVEGRRPDRAKGDYRGGQVWRYAARLAAEIGQKREVEILHGRLEDTLSDVLTAEQPAAVFADLQPDHPQYAGLVDEYRRYRAIVDAGGWPKVTRRRGLRRGLKGPIVTQLKQRLQIEGYFPEDAPIDDVFDDTLKAGVEAYQKTHQMKVDGRAHSVFWSSLNIPAERRVAQIALNMQRWRAANIRHSDPRYVWVNIPDFHVEIWDEQERAMRFRIVVGNNDLQIDEETRERLRPNRTPTLSAYIDRVIYNPFWNVTPRIRAEEILPEVRKQVEGSYRAKLSRLIAAKRADAGPPADTEQTLTSTRALAQAPQQPADPDANAQQPGESVEAYLTTSPDGDQLAFRVDKLRRLMADVGEPAPDAADPLTAAFPYLDPATGLVDVSTTNPDVIPAWYEQNQYEVIFPGKKWEYVRMKQGDDNALGKVKVIFPNLHDVYLHDTPKKALFSRDIRAFSHGCMRMHKPLRFSEYLLERDGQLDDYNVDRILADMTYAPIFLRRQVPVHIDYMTVRVDDDGRAHFLADIYDYDDEALSGSGR